VKCPKKRAPCLVKAEGKRGEKKKGGRGKAKPKADKQSALSTRHPGEKVGWGGKGRRKKRGGLTEKKKGKQKGPSSRGRRGGGLRKRATEVPD